MSLNWYKGFMSTFIRQLILGLAFLYAGQAMGEKDRLFSTLHLQIWDEGVCTAMLPSPSHAYFRYKNTKHVLQSANYHSMLYAYVISKDSGDLNPKVNHQNQSSSLQFKPLLSYELLFLRSQGFDKSKPDSMVIEVSNLTQDAQVMIPFKKGKFKLRKMRHFKTIQKNPQFNLTTWPPFKLSLKLDSTAYYINGKPKVKYYQVAPNFPLFYVQMYDSLDPSKIAQGYQLIQPHQRTWNSLKVPVIGNAFQSKYGYWEYYQKGKRTRHELWSAVLKEKYEFFANSQLKSESYYGNAQRETKHVYYNMKGAILEEYVAKSNKQKESLKIYTYSTMGSLVILSIYNSANGITKQGLQKRSLYYPSGKLKMEESFSPTYHIKYYNEDGTQKSK